MADVLLEPSRAVNPPRPSPRRILPVAVLRIWPSPAALSAPSPAEVVALAGTHWLRPDLAVVLPQAGDPAVYDTALELARRLPGRAGQAALLLPGQVVVDERTAEGIELAADALLAELEQSLPDLTAGRVYATARVAVQFETRRRISHPILVHGPTGRPVPCHRIGREDPFAEPWRHPELLRRRLPFERRPAFEAAWLEAQGAPVVWVVGALGTGKTRWLAEMLRGEPVLWANVRSPRLGGPSLAAQLAFRLGLPRASAGGATNPEDWLGPGPSPAGEELAAQVLARLVAGDRPDTLADGRLTVVCDDVERAGAADREFLARLATAGAGERLRLVVVSRGAGPSAAELGEAAGRAAVITFGPMTAAESRGLAASATAGFGLPPRVVQAFEAAAAGHPFAFAEGLAALAAAEHLRDDHGSLSYDGGETLAYLPSERWIRHVEAEVGRLGDPWPLHLLALAEEAIPQQRLDRAVAAVGFPVETEWANDARAAGLLVDASSPWGPAVDLRCPAVRWALRQVLVPTSVRSLIMSLGRELIEDRELPTSTLPSAADAPLSTRELLPALTKELARLRAVGVAPETELEALWSLLPLARRANQLERYRPDLERALELAGEDASRRFAVLGLKAEADEDAGRLDEAADTLRNALRDAAASTEQGRAVYVLRLGRLLIRQGRQEEARELLEQVVPILEAAGARSLAANGRFYLGNIARHQHHLDLARELHQEALAERRRLRAAKPVAQSLSALGAVELAAGRYLAALAAYEEAEGIFRDRNEPEEEAFATLGRGRALSRLGDYFAAATALHRARELREGRSDAVGLALLRLAMAENQLDLGLDKKALEIAREAYFDLELASAVLALPDAHQLLGRILAARRQREEAARHFAQARDGHHQLGDLEQAAHDLSWELVLSVDGDDDAAVERAIHALRAALLTCPEAERREVLEYRLYLAYERLWRRSEARPYLKRAYALLMEKTESLTPELRHRFLFQVREHAEIVQAATQAGLVTA